MRNICLKTVFLTVFACLVASTMAPAQSPEEFQKRRAAVREKMEPNSVLILRGNAAGEEFTGFRQENYFYYLTGINEPGASLILYSGAAPSGRRYGARTETVFVNPRNTSRADWEAQTLGIEGAEKLGFSDARLSAEFHDSFDRVLMSSPSIIYIDYQRSRSLREPPSADEWLFKLARDKGASFKLMPVGSLVDAMRVIKSPAETDLIKTAAAITAEAHKEAMRTAEPGMYEYQLQSVIEHVFSMNGAQRPGFSSIVGSGRNSCILHWSENSSMMNPGDIVVIDIGAEYNMYTADVTRTIPVDGKFTPRQKEIYEIVLRANEAAIGMVGPEVNMRDINSKVNGIMAEGLIKLNMIKDQSELRRYYFHGLSHPIGLQVHDVGRTGVLKPGMIITIEPGLYVREEGLGVRIEDDVLVTETGHINLTAAVPKSIAEVEKYMSEKGLNYRQYLIRKQENE